MTRAGKAAEAKAKAASGADQVRVAGSLRNRLVLTLIGGAALLALLLYLLIRGYATQIAQQGQDNILGAAVASILDAASIQDGAAQIDLPYGSFSMLNTPSDDRVFYAIHQDGRFLSGYDTLAPLEAPQERQGAFANAQFQGDAVRVVTAARTLVGSGARTRISVTLAQTQDALAVTLARISRNAALFGTGFFALAALLSFWVTASAVGQLQRLSDAVARRGPQDLRPFTQPVPTEMTPLVGSLNTLVRRLDHSLQQSEDFIAEAAHRVRTPLATVRSHAEATLQRVGKEENRQALRAMVRAIDESSRAAGQLLDHAMITFRADNLARQEIDLVEMVTELVQRMRPIAEMNDLELQLTAPASVPYRGDPILLQSALRNALDNALKYAPSDSAVEIAVTEAPLIAIRDSGPGFPPEEIDHLATRFRRGANAEGTIGSGLGLTIAQDVLAAHGGRLELANRDGGGACVTFLL
ncbi:Tricarboxylate transport sensor protein TctE [Candidatus Rhodobacter oscarellae]|uniref:histidine kinase n=1 Tax=Candidatus Rhodobacter oscarellae TaxID=1675527 RepID=A0A0J9EEK7_9RHOB|nr:sensor histidine kinase [Candidatus Rhodobacter lobularis]KMW60124.1 Tricarboxylate transport sensor protein TctE [Candidatus Rhodobacter lobularis]